MYVEHEDSIQVGRSNDVVVEIYYNSISPNFPIASALLCINRQKMTVNKHNNEASVSNSIWRFRRKEENQGVRNAQVFLHFKKEETTELP